MTAITFTGVPTFRIDAVAPAKAHYVDFLGFQVDWEHRFGPDAPVYMQVSRDGLILHLTENPRFPPQIIAFVATTGIEAFRRELAARRNDDGVPAVESTPWGTLQLELEDPFGNLLRFNQVAGA